MDTATYAAPTNNGPRTFGADGKGEAKVITRLAMQRRLCKILKIKSINDAFSWDVEAYAGGSVKLARLLMDGNKTANEVFATLIGVKGRYYVQCLSLGTSCTFFYQEGTSLTSTATQKREAELERRFGESKALAVPSRAKKRNMRTPLVVAPSRAKHRKNSVNITPEPSRAKRRKAVKAA